MIILKHSGGEQCHIDAKKDDGAAQLLCAVTLVATPHTTFGYGRLGPSGYDQSTI